MEAAIVRATVMSLAPTPRGILRHRAVPVLQATTLGPSQVQLTWTKSTDNIPNYCCSYSLSIERQSTDADTSTLQQRRLVPFQLSFATYRPALTIHSPSAPLTSPERIRRPATPRAPRPGPATTLHRQVFPLTSTLSVLTLAAAKCGWDGHNQLMKLTHKTISSMRYM